MKKIALFICMACVAMGMSAQTITSRSRIWLKSAGETDKDVRLLVSSSFSNDWDNTWDATPAQDGGIYVYYQGAKFSIWASNEYSENLALAFDANNNTSYTLSFASFMGQTYKIKDLVADQEFEVNASTPDYVFTIDATLKNTSILDRFVINYNPAPAPVYAAEVTTNENGLATFSHASDLAPVEAGVKLYKGAVSGETLALTPVADIAAEQGVIVYGEANTTYHFNVINGATADFAGNQLLAATAWESPHPGFDTYVLSGNALYLYEGTNFPANKAFLKIAQSANPSPRRIRLVFDQATAIDNISADNVKAEKVVENGQILIRRGNEVYNLQGQIVK